jgi:hypothetical protein
LSAISLYQDIFRYTAELVKAERELQKQRLERIQQIPDNDEIDGEVDAANVL